MRKIIYCFFLTFCILTFSLLTSSEECENVIFDVPKDSLIKESRLKNNDNVKLSSLMTSYFSNLTKYQANNIGGSCGFVSLVSVLSYYDSIKNDNIIPERYERRDTTASNYEEALQTSPGVVRSGFSVKAEDENFNSILYNYISSTYTSDFESYLVKKFNEMNSTYNSNDIVYGIDGWHYDKLLSYAIPVNHTIIEDCAPSSEEAESDYYTEKFLSETKTYIDEGKPVILHIVDKYIDDGKEERDHHSVVAYDYDEKGLYCNFGWDANNVHKNFYTGNYDYIYYLTVIDFDSSTYGHSNNLVYDGTEHCYCGETTHNHDCNIYEEYSDSFHLVKCDCGYSYLEGHIYDPRQLQIKTRIFDSCLLCGHCKGGNII